MSVPVAVDELAEAMHRYRFAYLMTVGGDQRVHVVAVQPRLEGSRLLVDNPGRRSSANAEGNSAVSLVWPPADATGYSLIVDGDASMSAEAMTVAPTRAVKHRPAAPDQDTPAGACGSDCVPVGSA